MLAAVPLYEMAETLCLLAGSNAGNAARHFSRQSYDAGDIASAILWTSVARVLDRMASAAREPEGALAMPPAPLETLAAVADLADDKFKATSDFHRNEYGAAADDQGVLDRGWRDSQQPVASDLAVQREG